MSTEHDQDFDGDGAIDHSDATVIEHVQEGESAARDESPISARPEHSGGRISEGERGTGTQPEAETQGTDAEADHLPEAERELDAVPEVNAVSDVDVDKGQVPQPSGAASQSQIDDESVSLFDQDERRELQSQWLTLQATFVDSPSAAVSQADGLVGETIARLTSAVAQRKQTLERQWSGEADADTERMRQALRGYRALLNQLLAI